MMKLLFVIFFLWIHQTYAQQHLIHQPKPASNDSSLSDSIQLFQLEKQTKFESEINFKKALAIAQQGAALALKSGNKSKLPLFLEMEGNIHSFMLHLDSALLCLNKALSGYIQIGDNRGQATSLFKLSWIFNKSGERDKALAADLKAATLMENLNDVKGIAIAYSRIADDLSGQGRLTEAMKYAKRAVDICETNHLDEEKVYALTSTGNVKMAEKDYLVAYNFFNNALHLANSLHFSNTSISPLINNKACALKYLEQYPSALKEYETSLAISEKSGNISAMVDAKSNLGDVNLQLGKYDKALMYLLSTLDLQESNNDLSNIIENYLHISSIYEHLGNYKSALQYQKKALLIRDSIASVKSNENMAELLTQYETKKKEATIVSQQREIDQQLKIQWLGGGILVLLAGIIVFGLVGYRVHIKRSRMLATKNAENELLIKEIHHRVKNNLEVVSSLLALHSAKAVDERTKMAMLESQNQVRSIGIVHQKLYLGENPGTIELKDYFSNLSENILDSFGAEQRVKIELIMEKLFIDIDTAIPLGLIVNELITNTIKYAFLPGQIGHVRINLEKTQGNSLHLVVEDDGIGKSDHTAGTGFGTQLISLLTKQLNGSIKEETGNGTRIVFDFKPNKIV